MLCTFVGCAGVGKNTIIKELIRLFPDKYEIFPTLTTRKMREGETEGNPYYFVSREQFEKLLAEGEIYEYQQIHDGSYYGGSKKVLKKHLESGKILIKDIDVLGAETYKRELGSITKILSLFLCVDDVNTLLDRMRGRGDSEESIQQRAKRFPMEMELSKTCDYLVANEDIQLTARIVDILLTNEATNGIYELSSDCPVPTNEEIERYSGAGGIVRLCMNGRELLITQGADAYAASKRSGIFVQKQVEPKPDFSCATKRDKWFGLIENA
ncbi:MAG: hypothetical protein K5663_01220 [Clostridiales bacterium]|nr:hypothetical protein [Clostridiales bacterium]